MSLMPNSPKHDSQTNALQAAVEHLRAELKRKQAQLEKCVYLMRLHQWFRAYGVKYCRHCHMSEDAGCKPDCTYAAALIEGADIGGKLYRHYKGGVYRILAWRACGQDSLTKSPVVESRPFIVYQSVENGDVFVRPHVDFCVEVEPGKMRFEEIKCATS